MVSSLLVWEESKVGHESCPCYGQVRLLSPESQRSYNQMQTVCSSLGVSPWRAHGAPWVPRLLFICCDCSISFSLSLYLKWIESHKQRKVKSTALTYGMCSKIKVTDLLSTWWGEASQSLPWFSVLPVTCWSHILVSAFWWIGKCLAFHFVKIELSIYVEWIQILLNKRTWFLRGFFWGGGIQKWIVIFFLGLLWELN